MVHEPIVHRYEDDGLANFDGSVDNYRSRATVVPVYSCQ